ncbi:MAG TPA: carbonic anhydrase [Bryobacteraceae bacterium]|nr:carbonic anhydrase [Bryobacteraceae bacterium]
MSGSATSPEPVLRKILHFDSPAEVYKADACVITCFDARFDAAIRKFLKGHSITLYDHVKIPGSAKVLGAPDYEADRDFAMRMVRTSIRLHRPTRFLLIGHNDCGAYPGKPPAVVSADLLQAAAYLRKAEPSIPVDAYFADFDGIYEVA